MRTFCRLILAVWLLAGLCVRADTVKLKDGTTLDGEIESEDSSSVAILLEFANGTITQTRHIDRKDIARITRWTPEQRARRETEREYEALQKYQLNPATSYQPEYYDEVISNVFRAFLAKHADSPFTSNVTERIVEWKAERDLVAAGNVKFVGRWSPAAEVAPLIERAWGQELLQQARALMSQRRFETAVQRLQFVVHMDRQPELVSRAKPLLASAYQLATNLLDHEQRQLARDVASAQERLDQAQQELRAAEALLTQPTDTNSESSAQAQIAVNLARTELNAAQDHLEYVKSQQDAAKHRLAMLKSQTPGVTTSTAAPPAARQQPAPSPTTESPEVLGGLVTWVKNNWVAMAVIVAVILFLISRLLIKD